MGFVVLGIFSLTVIGIDGAVFTMLSHPLTTGALFLVVGMLYERRHTCEISDVPRHLEVGADPRPRCSSSRCSPASACPGFSGFVGEFLVALGTFSSTGRTRSSRRPA